HRVGRRHGRQDYRDGVVPGWPATHRAVAARTEDKPCRSDGHDQSHFWFRRDGAGFRGRRQEAGRRREGAHHVLMKRNTSEVTTSWIFTPHSVRSAGWPATFRWRISG